MKVMALLLISAVALLVNPAGSSSITRRSAASENLNEIIRSAEKYNRSLSKEFFVPDLEELVNDGCKDEFFCKVHDILLEHSHFGKRKNQEEQKIVRNLEIFISGLNPNCTVLVNPTAPTGSNTKPIPTLLEDLVTCIKRRNLGGM